MEQDEIDIIEKGNNLIWRFMGRKEMEADISFYRSDWNMLMPVTEKIENDYNTDLHSFFNWNGSSYDKMYTFTISMGGRRIAPKVTIESDSKIQSVWLVVVEFINWYNEQEWLSQDNK